MKQRRRVQLPITNAKASTISKKYICPKQAIFFANAATRTKILA
jgi:hypothetical protein